MPTFHESSVVDVLSVSLIRGVPSGQVTAGTLVDEAQGPYGSDVLPSYSESDVLPSYLESWVAKDIEDGEAAFRARNYPKAIDCFKRARARIASLIIVETELVNSGEPLPNSKNTEKALMEATLDRVEQAYMANRATAIIFGPKISTPSHLEKYRSSSKVVVEDPAKKPR